MKLTLNKRFASNGKVDEFDTREMKRILNRLGYYTPPKDFGSTHIPDRAVFEALKNFQRDNNILPTGATRPGDETEKTLNSSIAKQNPNEPYIWHTRNDDKVRSAHAARNGKTFTWNTNHDDGHPGEPFGCRCWAENIKKSKCEEEEIAWINAGAELFISKKNLERKEEEKNQLEEQQSQKEAELAKIDAQIKKEKQDKRDAKNKGAAIGGMAGAIIGAATGPGSSAGLAGTGIGVGAFIGALSEEIGDVASAKSKTDVSLGFKKQRLLKEIKELERKIEIFVNKISVTLIPEMKRAQEKIDKTRARLLECRNKNKG